MLSRSTVFLVCGVALAAFAIFATIAFDSDRDRSIIGASAKMEFAFTWTLRLAGTLIAIIAAVHLVRLAGLRDGVDQMVLGGVALLGGLTLISQYWVVITAFAVLLVCLMVQQFILRHVPARVARSDALENTRPAPRQEQPITAVQAERGNF
jgi:hypothetical protein